MIKAIIFDFDGVLVESVDVKTKAFARMFENKGEEVVKKVTDFHLINGGLSRVHKFKHYYEVILKCSLSEDKLSELCKTFSQLVVDEVINSPYVNGAKEFMEKLSSVEKWMYILRVSMGLQGRRVKLPKCYYKRMVMIQRKWYSLVILLQI